MSGGSARNASTLSEESSRVHVHAGLNRFERVPARSASTTILAGAESVKVWSFGIFVHGDVFEWKCGLDEIEDLVS